VFSDALQANPWLSVIIPTFNGAGTIGEALASVSAQNDPAIEVLVVDDGSTDSTLTIVRSYAHLLNLRILDLAHTGNWVANTNRGIEASSGVCLSILHQDDRWEPRRLALVREVLAKDSAVTMCLHPSFFIGPDSAVVGLWQCPFAARGEPKVIPPDVFVRCLLVQNFIAIPAPIFAKADAVRVNMLDESLIYTADWDFWLKLAGLGPSAYIPEPLTSFRVHPQSQTATLSRNADYMEQQLLCVLRRHFDRYAAGARSRAKLLKIASFSVETNVAFMRLANAQRSPWLRLFGDFVALGPRGWREYFRCSRIVDRTLARLRVGRHASVRESISRDLAGQREGIHYGSE
jgi:GT2 family glycosyltransferase